MAHAQTLALAVLATHQRLFSSQQQQQQREQRRTLTNRDVRKLTLADIENAIELEDYSLDNHQTNDTRASSAEQQTPHEPQRIRLGGEKHMRQQQSLFGHLKRIDVPPNKPNQQTTIVEVGAGRGMMGLVAAALLAAEGAKPNSSKPPIKASVENPSLGSSQEEQEEEQQLKHEEPPTMTAERPSKTQLLMIERTGSRGKADKAFRNIKDSFHSMGNLRMDLVDWQRVACDLRHVQFKTLMDQSFSKQEKEDQHPRKSVTVIGKHVCGVGTDLSLKALSPLCQGNQPCVDACILATCCHGVCNWNDYVGRDVLEDALLSTATSTGSDPPLTQFGRDEFECLRKWCAASVATTPPSTKRSTSDTRTRSSHTVSPSTGTPTKDGDAASINDAEEEEDDTHRSYDEGVKHDTDVIGASAIVESLGLSCGMTGFGRACQRLLDYGRMIYLRDVLRFESVKLVHYVPSSVTPQNAVLVAHRRTSN